MQIDNLLSLLNNVKQAGSGYLASCPAHDDKKPSLSISVSKTTGKILLCCQSAKCTAKSIVDALGVTFADLNTRENNTTNGSDPTEDPKLGKRVAVYPYLDENGNELFAMLRFVKMENGVSVKNMRPALKNSAYRSGYKQGIGNTRRVLFNLPEVLKAVEKGETVLLVEGEKDCLNLAKWGYVATTSVFGAGNWRAEYAETLQGADVVLVSDNDPAGYDYSRTIAHTLQGKAKRVRFLFLFNPKETAKGDASDWIEQGGTRERFAELIVTAPDYGEDVENTLALRSTKWKLSHHAEIDVPLEYPSRESWLAKLEELNRGYLSGKASYEFGIARCYLAKVKGVEHGEKGKVLREIFGYNCGTIQNLISAIKTFDDEGLIIPHDMPKSHLIQLAPSRVPTKTRREATELFRSGDIRTGEDIQNFLKEQGCAAKPKETEGADLLKKWLPHKLLLEVGETAKEDGSEALRDNLSRYVHQTPEERETLNALMGLVSGIREQHGEALASNLLATFQEMAEGALRTGELVAPANFTAPQFSRFREKSEEETPRSYIRSITTQRNQESMEVAPVEPEEQPSNFHDFVKIEPLEVLATPFDVPELPPVPLEYAVVRVPSSSVEPSSEPEEETDLSTSEEYYRLRDALPHIPKGERLYSDVSQHLSNIQKLRASREKKPYLYNEQRKRLLLLLRQSDAMLPPPL